MSTYEVIKPWSGVKAGQIVEIENLHPALRTNVRLVKSVADQSAPAPDSIIEKAISEANEIVAEAKDEGEQIIAEAKEQAQKIVVQAEEAAKQKGTLTPATPPGDTKQKTQK